MFIIVFTKACKRWVVSFTAALLPGKSPPVPTGQEAGWVPRAGLDGLEKRKIPSLPGRAARSLFFILTELPGLPPSSLPCYSVVTNLTPTIPLHFIISDLILSHNLEVYLIRQRQVTQFLNRRVNFRAYRHGDGKRESCESFSSEWRPGQSIPLATIENLAKCEFWDFHGGDVSNRGLLSCNAV
jgi:hypothetical protein